MPSQIYARRALAVWLLITAVCLAQILITVGWRGSGALAAVMMTGPGSNPALTALAVVLSWVVAGCTIAALAWRPATPERLLVIATYAGLSLLYVSLMRERTYYGDVEDYFRAALSLHTGTALPIRYLYPPLWAALLAPLTRFGENTVTAAIWLVNLLATFAAFPLTARVLTRFRFSERNAVLTTAALFVVNVPLYRTLGYGQINVVVLDLILMTLALYPQQRVLSAIALAAAVHFKISPIVLAFAFLWARDGRWLASFAAALLAIGLAPVAIYGWAPYAEVLANLLNMERANGLVFRETSFDSLARALNAVTGVQVEWAVLPAKMAFTLACLAAAVQHARLRTFADGNDTRVIVLNQAPMLLLLMVLASPLVWEHHALFLVLSYAVVATRLRQPRDWTIFGFAYYVEFLMPTFDFFPWSYGRLLSPLLILWLAWRARAYDSPLVST